MVSSFYLFSFLQVDLYVYECVENAEYEQRLEDANRWKEEQASKILNMERYLAQAIDSRTNLSSTFEHEKKDIERFKQNRDETWASLCDLLDK